MNKGNMIKEDKERKYDQGIKRKETWWIKETWLRKMNDILNSMIRIDPSMKVVPAGYEHHGISEKN